MTSFLLNATQEQSSWAQTPEETLAYEQYMLTTAIRSVNDLLSKQAPQAKSREYYDVILQVLIAMEETITRMEKINEKPL